MLPKDRCVVEIPLEGDTGLELWSWLLPVLCAAMGKTMKEAAADLSAIYPALSYRRLRAISSVKYEDRRSEPRREVIDLSGGASNVNELTEPGPRRRRVKPVLDDEAAVMIEYFRPAVSFLQFQGTTNRTLIDRRARRL